MKESDSENYNPNPAPAPVIIPPEPAQTEILKFTIESLRLENQAQKLEISFLKKENQLLKTKLNRLKKILNKLAKYIPDFASSGLMNDLSGETSDPLLSIADTQNLNTGTFSVIEGTGNNIEGTGKSIEETGMDIGETGKSNGETSKGNGETGKGNGETSKSNGETGKSIGETGKSIGKTGKENGETSKSIGETGKGIEETGKSIEETGKSIGETGKSIGGTSNNIGDPVIPVTGTQSTIEQTLTMTAASRASQKSKDMKGKESKFEFINKTPDLETVLNATIDKQIRHKTHLKDRKIKYTYYKHEKLTANLVLNALDKSYPLPDNIEKNPEQNKIITFNLLLALKNELKNSRRMIRTIINLTNVMIYLYSNGKVTFEVLNKKFNFNKTSIYRLVNILKSKSWIDPYPKGFSDAFYFSAKGRRFVQDIIDMA